MTCNIISLISQLIWKRFRWKFIDIYEDVCSLHTCFSADSFHLLCCITPCKISGRFSGHPVLAPPRRNDDRPMRRYHVTTARLLPNTSTDFMTLFCSLAVLNPTVGHTKDVLSPFISVLCHSDWLFHGQLSTSWCCPSRPCVVFLACVRLALFLALSLSPGIPLFPHPVTIVC